jgi:hypothetical protein
MVNLIASLPAAERARLCNELAAQTLRLADIAAEPETKASLLKLSKGWIGIAEDFIEERGAGS